VFGLILFQLGLLIFFLPSYFSPFWNCSCHYYLCMLLHMYVM
jgi:hypothetical protein